jgi:hypothetical protein
LSSCSLVAVRQNTPNGSSSQHACLLHGPVPRLGGIVPQGFMSCAVDSRIARVVPAKAGIETSPGKMMTSRRKVPLLLHSALTPPRRHWRPPKPTTACYMAPCAPSKPASSSSGPSGRSRAAQPALRYASRTGPGASIFDVLRASSRRFTHCIIMYDSRAVRADRGRVLCGTIHDQSCIVLVYMAIVCIL